MAAAGTTRSKAVGDDNTGGTQQDAFQIVDVDGNVVLWVDKEGGIFVSLPTADPAVTGQLWANSDVVTVSTP
jgi:hypothetical protein